MFVQKVVDQCGGPTDRLLPSIEPPARVAKDDHGVEVTPLRSQQQTNDWWFKHQGCCTLRRMC